MSYTNLWDIARKYYKTSGANQLPHVLRVYEHAKLLRGRELTLEEAVAVIFHDFTKSSIKGIPHGLSAAMSLKSMLDSNGEQLEASQLESAMVAIAYHDDDNSESPSDLADLLRSADALPPDLGMYLFKAFHKSSEGRTPDEAYTRVLKAVQSGRPLMEHMRYRPKLYFRVYASEVETLKSDMDRCKTSEDVRYFINRYLEAHPDADPEV